MALLLELAQFDVLGADPSPVEGSLWCKSTGLSVYTGGVTRPLEMTTNKNVANGYPGLDVNARLAQAQLPLGSLLQTQYAQVVGNTTTTSATFVTLLTVNITTAASQCVIHAMGHVSNSTANRNMRFRVAVDGVSQGGGQFRSVAANIGVPFSLQFRPTLTAGAHVVTLQWAREASGTMQCRPVAAADSETASLMVQELKT